MPALSEAPCPSAGEVSWKKVTQYMLATSKRVSQGSELRKVISCYNPDREASAPSGRLQEPREQTGVGSKTRVFAKQPGHL